MVNQVRAEMVAAVIAVSVSTGQQVAVGDQLVLLESMKMEIPVLSEYAGTVTQIAVAVGDVIQESDLIVELGS